VSTLPHFTSRFCILTFQVLDDSDPENVARLLKHTETYSQEREPLVDSATFFGGKPRTIPSPQRTFIPVGHTALGHASSTYINVGYVKDEEGLYWIANFYFSRALQGSGLGRAAMDTVENLAIQNRCAARSWV
jgi:hypothetical protein